MRQTFGDLSLGDPQLFNFFFLQKGVRAEVVCAPICESFDLQVRISLPGGCAPVSLEFDYARGTCQGSVLGLICGTRCRTMRCGSVQHVGKLKELAFDFQRTTVGPKEKTWLVWECDGLWWWSRSLSFVLELWTT